MRIPSSLRAQLLLLGALGSGACEPGVIVEEQQHAARSGASVCIVVGQGLRCRVDVPADVGATGADTNTDVDGDTLDRTDAAKPTDDPRARIRSGVSEDSSVGGRRSIRVRIGDVTVIDGGGDNTVDFRVGRIE